MLLQHPVWDIEKPGSSLPCPVFSSPEVSSQLHFSFHHVSLWRTFVLFLMILVIRSREEQGEIGLDHLVWSPKLPHILKDIDEMTNKEIFVSVGKQKEFVGGNHVDFSLHFKAQTGFLFCLENETDDAST